MFPPAWKEDLGIQAEAEDEFKDLNTRLFVRALSKRAPKHIAPYSLLKVMWSLPSLDVHQPYENALQLMCRSILIKSCCLDGAKYVPLQNELLKSISNSMIFSEKNQYQN